MTRTAKGFTSRMFVLALGILAVGAFAPAIQAASVPSPVTQTHLNYITGLFQQNGIRGGMVTLDRQGRVELNGTYEDNREVDRAFSLAQTVVGPRWVSPVTPQNIRVKDWETCLSRIMAGETCEGAPSPPTATGPPGAGRATAAPVAETPPGPIKNRYALVVGVGRFANGINPLQYANKDAYDFYSYLVYPQGGGFPRENVILVRDEYATRDTIRRGFEAIKAKATEDDFVLLYFSSHGTPPDKYGGVHLVTYDSQPTPREKIWETSVTEPMLRDFIQQIRAKRLVVVMDACYSNGAYSQVAGFLPPGGKSLDSDLNEGYGRSGQDMARRLLGAKDLVVDEPSTAQRPGARPTGWGKVLISASDSGERSWESDTLRNSIFTRYFLNGLEQNGGAVQEAFEYTKTQVPARVKAEKGADITQTPQLTTNRRDWNMSLAGAGR